MRDPSERNPATGVGWGDYPAWAPSGMFGGTSKNGGISLALGIVSLVLAATSTLPLLAWIALLSGIVSGLTVWLLPGGTTSQKLMSGVGFATALGAVVLMIGV
jgi:hypothetical protein